MNINFLNRIPQSLFTRTATNNKMSPNVPIVLSEERHQPISDQELKEEGKNEQTKNKATKREEDKQTVSDLIKKSNRCIISVSTHFPWTLFPNTIHVEESSVTFVFRQFIAVQTYSVGIKDISNVFIESSPFFSTLQIVSRTFTQNDITIGHLNTKEAIRVKMIIEGLRTFTENNIDTSNYEIKELIAKIEEFYTHKTI
ncbi:MAG: hypothetical protein HQK77_17655 [Desulfobacterales bacterium]|nr:hypothetical protein [Desulfobacterales bacterium]